MRLFIIQPSHYVSRANQVVYKTRRRSVVGLTLPYLAALTPKDWDITLIDEQLSDIDFDAPVDLVAITSWTISSFRAYEIADRFRARGVPVIMGGPHTFFYSEEAARHCDAVGIGEGETIWPRMLEDAARGRLEKIYRAESMYPLKGLPFPRYELLNLRAYGFMKAFSVQASRGCPFKCEFCSERFYLGHKYRCRPVEEVVEEIRYSRAKNLLFADSNFAGKRAHAVALMEALIPLKVRWSALWSAHLCKNRNLLDLAKRSGLLHVNIGIESIDQSTLAGMKKWANKVNEYKEIFDNLRRRRISYSVNLIFGWDSENKGVFASTLAFLKEHKVPVAYFNILTPHWGTVLYERMKIENRITDEHHIGRWPGIHCYIRPAYCTAEELEDSVRNLYKEFYSLSSMIRRLSLPLSKADIASWLVNMSQRRMSRARSDVENFDRY